MMTKKLVARSVGEWKEKRELYGQPRVSGWESAVTMKSRERRGWRVAQLTPSTLARLNLMWVQTRPCLSALYVIHHRTPGRLCCGWHQSPLSTTGKVQVLLDRGSGKNTSRREKSDDTTDRTYIRSSGPSENDAGWRAWHTNVKYAGNLFLTLISLFSR
jgi:hypothetical protein